MQDALTTDEILAAAMSALPGIKVTNAAGYNVSPADTIRAALTAALPLIRAGVVEAKLNAAYLAGFNASGEGWNGEWPFQDNGRDPTEDEHWCECRAAAIRKLGAGDG